MSNLEEAKLIENHIKEGRSSEFIRNCLLAVGEIDLKVILENKLYGVLEYLLKNEKVKCNIDRKMIQFIQNTNVDDNKLIRVFLEAGANPTIGNNYPIRYAKGAVKYKIYEELVSWCESHNLSV